MFLCIICTSEIHIMTSMLRPQHSPWSSYQRCWLKRTDVYLERGPGSSWKHSIAAWHRNQVPVGRIRTLLDSPPMRTNLGPCLVYERTPSLPPPFFAFLLLAPPSSVIVFGAGGASSVREGRVGSRTRDVWPDFLGTTGADTIP
jgi:hypothetical protein